MKTLNVDLGEAKYPVIIGGGLFKNLLPSVKSVYKGKKVLLVSDELVWELFGESISQDLSNDFEVHHFLAKGGKDNKTFFTVMEVFRVLEESNFSRDSLLIAVGGGVVGDLGGFVASCWYRGMNLIHIPTTMLSMVDSCLGGKTAINFRETINAVGSYYHPSSIYIDTDIIKSLPEREVISGFGEILKYGVISDPDILSRLEHQKMKIFHTFPSEQPISFQLYGKSRDKVGYKEK